MEYTEFKSRMAALPPITGDSVWERNRKSLREHVASSDSLDDFLSWSTIVATMFTGNTPIIEDEWKELFSKSSDEWLAALFDPGVGGAPRLEYAPNTNGNIVHQAYHLHMLETTAWIDSSRLRSVTEIGGGYGAMAVLFRQLGYAGSYAIFDSPEFSLLQHCYLSLCGYSYDIHCHGHAQSKPADSDLLIACYSLSEMKHDDRLFYLSANHHFYLIAYQDVFDGIDNNFWFKAWTATRPDMGWTFLPMTLRPGNWYLIGIEK